ncbi:S-adenosylmethionine mitochondrial carrier protein isoform X2 [Fukomys damarensis]|uniref:S-adenosylmethionine mitochondrial carrier protein isoform X2 n=1 Tax=Fukomys damarensis TaxID=885580 RepID=UPI00053F35EA|nr:S-adenosylmethionine mitochondrial carrier protein isoform X2 [Fukomys damarensis]
MLAASAGEVVACLIRVPSEVVKQRAQVSASSRTFQIFCNILYEEGLQGLYRGYKSTVLREIRKLRLRRIKLGRDSFFFGPVFLVGILKGPLVLAAGSCSGFLAVSSVWSFCRLNPARQVGTCFLPYEGSGGHRGSQGYSLESSLEWQQSAWEASSFWVLMSKPAACCPEWADKVGEAEAVRVPSQGKVSVARTCLPGAAAHPPGVVTCCTQNKETDSSKTLNSLLRIPQ